MRRREFITLSAVRRRRGLSRCGRSSAPRCCASGPSNSARERPTWRAFEQRLRELGYVEGENLAVDYSIERNFHLYASATQEMMRRKVDIIVATSNDVLKSAMAATKTLPIVMVALDFDPFRLGYLTSLARPTGNVTGVFLQQVELSLKRLQILKEAFPTIEAATVFWDHRSTYQWQKTQDAAASLGLRLAGIELRDLPYDYDQALARIPPDHRDILLVMASPLFFGDRQRLADFARRQRIASVFGQREHVEAGGLMSYGRASLDVPARRRICRQDCAWREPREFRSSSRPGSNSPSI